MTQKILSKNQSKFNKAEADEKKRLRNIESLELQLADLSSIKNNFIKELSNKNIQLNDDDRKNYLQLRAKVSAKRDELNPNNQIDQRKKNYIERKLTYEKIQLDEINLILSHKLNMKETLKKNVLQLETVKRQTQENLTQVHEKLDGMKSKILSEDDVEGLKTQLEEIQMKLNDLNIASEYKKKQQKNQTIINILKKKIDGVHGRLHEFCQPIDKRYQTAMGKAFGNKYFGIIVDDSTTAATCIKFLKEHRMSPQLFIPMDNIKCTPLKEQLRSIKDLKDVHLLIDLLKYDVKYKNVVLNAAGSTLVCRNTDDARIVAFETTKMRNDETREYLDAVSLDGVFFRKNGSFSGKGSDFDMIKHIENSKEFNELTQKKRELLLKLLEHNNSTSSMAMSTIKEQEQLLLTYKNRSSYCEGNLAKIEKKLHELELSISELNEQKKNTQDNLKTLEQDLKNLDEEMTNEGENLDTQIAQYEKEIFTNFCKQKNIDNIKEFENFISLIEKKHEKLEDLNDQCSRIEELLKYERANKSIIEKISSYEDKLQELGDKITEMNDIRNSLQDEIKIISIEQSALENQLKEDKKKIALYSAKISELSLDLEQTTQKIIKLENEIDNYRHKKLEKLREKHDLLLKAKIQSIDLPMLKGNLDDLFSDDSSQDSWQNIQEREFQLKFDYSILPDNQLNEINSLNINLIKEKYQKDLSDIENEIGETTIPEAHDKLKNVDLKLKHLRTQKLQHAKKLNEKMRKFELIKWKRADKFNKFFKNVEESIGEIYKTLSGETAAQAVLMLYNPEEPYLDGIEYECCPSNKQRLPMSSFSGGERTIAGLSLLFSLRSALPPPFLIMDEIDGPLDKHHFNNLIKFFNTIKEKQQIILISLNDKIFSKSDVVIGVMKKICDFEDPKSQAFNINLEAYPQD
ncbi:structural maintenance of chromosomes protein 1B-like [Aphidius gifuensis]|nr:structural maintenance of chromosomes protein 1B-like [Aphidius gifuensis]